MADVTLKIISNFEQASKDIREFGTATESQRQKVQNFVDSFKTESIDKFMDKNTRAAAAVKATQGPMQATQVEYKNLQREIQKLIRNGLDPQDAALKPLITRYQQLEKELDDNARAQKATEKVSAVTAASLLYIGKTALNTAKQIISFGKDLVDAYGVQEQAEKALAIAIEATGKTAGISMQDMKEYASSLQAATLYGDESILSAQGVLQSLADLDQEGLQQVTPAVMDFATAMGVDLQTAMSLVGKTLGSSTNALSRYGLSIDMTGTKEEKLAELTEQLGAKFGGAAEAAADTSTGSFKQLSNALGDVKEAMGATIADGAAPFVRTLTDYASRVAESISATREFKNVMDSLESQTGNVNSAIDDTRQALEYVNEKLAMNEGRHQRLTYAAAAQYKADKEALEAKLAQLQQLQYQETRRVDAATAAERRIAAEMAAEEAAAASLQTYLDEVADAYGKTTQGKIDALEAEIATWEEYAKTANKTAPQVNAVLEMLRDQLEGMTGDTEDAGESWSDWFKRIVKMGETAQQKIDRENEEAAERWKQLQEDKMESVLTATDAIAAASTGLSKALKGDAEDVYDFVVNTAADLAADVAEEMGPEGKIVASAITGAKAIADAWQDLGETILGNLEDYNDGYKDIQLQIIDAQKDAIDQQYDNTKLALDRERDATLDSLEKKYASELMTEEEYLTAKEKAEAAYQEKADKAKETAEAEARKLARQRAEIEKAITLAEIEISRNKAIADLGWFNKSKKADVNALYDTLVTAVNSIPLPSLQTGTLPSGYTVPESASTRGDPSLLRVNPGEHVNVTPKGEGGGNQTIVVKLDKETLFSVVNKGIKSGEIVITAANLN